MDISFHQRQYGDNMGNAHLNGLTYEIPKKCPYCQFANNPTRISTEGFTFNGGLLQVFSWKCANCGKYYVTGHTRKDWSDKKSVFLFMFPSPQLKEFGEFISNLSPRFVEVYREANSSEVNGNLTVAGMGYRLALEILIKDYAIKEKNVSEEEASKKSLFQAIEEYLPNAEYIAAADVVRLKGNDYAHYKNKLENVEFNEMKFYLDTLIDLINVQLRLIHPPVRRQ